MKKNCINWSKITMVIKLICYGVIQKKKEVGCMLYDSFLFTCNVNDRYGSFGCGIVLQNDAVAITDFLGKRTSHNNDEHSIKESLKMVDDYCRLRLPDKFLKAYDEAYKK